MTPITKPTAATCSPQWGVTAAAVCLLTGTLLVSSARGQEPVVGTANADRLFTSSDPKLNINAQAAYHIVKDLLEANHWELAEKWLSADYLQHNPNVISGRDPVVEYFSEKYRPTPIPAHMKTKIVAVVAQGDLVIVVTPWEIKDPHNSGKTYTTSWFDMWRFKDGKAVEHWDNAIIGPPPQTG